MTTTPQEEPIPTTSDADPTPPLEIGRHVHKGTLSVMWGGVWVPLGEAEFETDNGRVVNVLSYTPREFRDGE